MVCVCVLVWSRVWSCGYDAVYGSVGIVGWLDYSVGYIY